MPNKSVEPTPLPFAIRFSLVSLFILFLSIILFAKRGSSPQTLAEGIRRMRTNSDFLKQLRIEILETQKRRESFIKAKLTFVVGLLGIGAISIGGSIKTTPLLYLVPLVAFIFDLYILGEDFGVKRAGTFIKTSPAAPLEERIWEKGLGSKRDWYSYFAHPLSSIVVLTAAAVGIHVSEINILPFWPWIFINSVFILIVVAYKPLLKKSMQHFEDTLDKEVRESDNKG